MEGAAKIESHPLRSVLFQQETMIFVIFAIVSIININLSSNYLNFNNTMNNMMALMDKVLTVFTIMTVPLLGEIDISIASIMCLSGCCTGVILETGLPIIPAMIAGLLVEVVCGFFNGILLVAFPDLNSTIVTLGNQILFRRIVYMILEDKPVTSISSKMSLLTWSKVAEIPLILIIFLVGTLVFAFVAHRTRFGHSLYAIGSNAKASRLSGIRTNRIKALAFTFSRLCAGFARLSLISKLGSVKASITKGYKIEVIAMATPSGVSATGGKGKVLGAVLGVFSVGFLRCGLEIVNASSQILMTIIGALLVVAVVIPNLKEVISEPASGGWTRLRVIRNKQK